MKTMRAWSALCVVLGVGCFAPQVPESNDLAVMEVEVLGAVQATMDGLAAHDSVVLSERVLPERSSSVGKRTRQECGRL